MEWGGGVLMYVPLPWCIRNVKEGGGTRERGGAVLINVPLPWCRRCIIEGVGGGEVREGVLNGGGGVVLM